MNTIIVGAGMSGLTAAILLPKRRASYRIGEEFSSREKYLQRETAGVIL